MTKMCRLISYIKYLVICVFAQVIMWLFFSNVNDPVNIAWQESHVSYCTPKT